MSHTRGAPEPHPVRVPKPKPDPHPRTPAYSGVRVRVADGAESEHPQEQNFRCASTPVSYEQVDGFDGLAELLAVLGWTRPGWMRRAACIDYPLDVFFDATNSTRALAVCSTCSMLVECRDWALSSPHAPAGCVVGGMDAAALKAARRARGLRRRRGGRDDTS